MFKAMKPLTLLTTHRDMPMSHKLTQQRLLFEDEAPVAEPNDRFSGSGSRFSEESPAPPQQSLPASLPTTPRTTAEPAAIPSKFSQREQVQHRNSVRTEIARRNDVVSVGKPGPQHSKVRKAHFTIQKIVPSEIQVGRPAKFEIRVRNMGRVPADRVVIRDEIPEGTNFVDASPKATHIADGAIFWDAGSLAPGQEVSISMELMPTMEGLIGSVATVAFESSASARTRSTKPGLVIEHTGPQTVLIGEPVRFSIKLTNPGTGTTSNVVLEEDVLPGSRILRHQLEYAVGTIPNPDRHDTWS